MAISKIDSGGIAASGITADSLDIGQIGGRRNLIINGAMQVAQRGDQTSISTSTYGASDRWRLAYEGSSSVWTLDNSNTVAPEGFSNSYKLLCTTADASQDAISQVALGQRIEAQNLQHLKYGTSNAQSLTLSFWVRSNKTGTYAVTMYSQDGGRIIGSTYTISAADTWEYKTITFAGDTSGTINNDNGTGLEVKFIVSAGSTYSATDNTSWGAFSDGKLGYGQTVDLADTLNNDWYITGVQLEVGSVATPFEHRSYGEELALCQRYCYVISESNGAAVFGTGHVRQTSGGYIHVPFPVPMRTAPTGITVSSASHFQIVTYGDVNANCSTITASNISTLMGTIDTTTSGANYTVGRGISMYPNTGQGGTIEFTGAEL